MLKFLLIVQAIIAISLITVILMQRSEGGGLGVGGSSSGFMTARGAADFLTRSTSILGGIFIVLSIVMAGIAGVSRQSVEVDTSLAGKGGLTAPTQQKQPAAPAEAPKTDGKPAEKAPAVPLAQ